MPLYEMYVETVGYVGFCTSRKDARAFIRECFPGLRYQLVRV